MRYLKIRSRNKSTHMLDRVIPTGKLRFVYRAGSTTSNEDVFKNLGNKHVVEINTAASCKYSGDKILMKIAFDEGEVKHAQWDCNDNINNWEQFPAIIKHIHSSQGKGIYYISDLNSLEEWLDKRNPEDHIIEKYYTYSKEYRVHICNGECFHAIRKMLKSEAEERWHRHNNTCVCILPENPLFDKPNNWDEIVEGCAKAMDAVGLTIGAVDVKVQTKKDNPEFIILETNSAPSLKEITLEKYKEQLIKIVESYV